MTKSTGAVILTSPARLAPWGDDGWRFSGAMQLVQDGPDWLHAEWTVPGGPDDAATSPYGSMVLRDASRERASDVAVMTLALLRVPGWEAFAAWWADIEQRSALQPALEKMLAAAKGEMKLAIMETVPGAVDDRVEAALTGLGFEVTKYTP
jgi:hypothetical protein